jgi:GNAT superfamily N-acetyltransferase
VEAAARKAGCDLLFLRTNQRRTDSHAFYRAEGFEETHRTFNKRL